MAREWVVTGRVQGVGFRAFTVQCARTYGVLGWVANRRDGSVVVTAEGETGPMRAFEARLRRGPTMARVDQLEEIEREPAGYTDFQIRVV